MSKPITPANCWSVRDCIERVPGIDAKASSAIDALDELGREAGMTLEDGSRCSEHQAVVDALLGLFELVDHMVANLKGGMVMPRAPLTRRAAEHVDERAAARPPVSDPMLAKAKRHTTGAATTHGLRLAAKAEAAAKGWLGTEEARAFTGYTAVTPATWYAHRKDGLVPEPHAVLVGLPFWTREQLQDVRYTPSRRGDRGPTTNATHQEGTAP